MRLNVKQLYVTGIGEQLKAKVKPPQGRKRSTLPIHGIMLQCQEHLGGIIIEAVARYISLFTPSHNVKSV